jgi:hypothetical protein
MPWEKVDALTYIHVIHSDSAEIIVKTSDGRTGDKHQFHMEAVSLHATLDSAGSSLAIWGTEPALPNGSYDPSVGCASRNFRLVISRVAAELLRDALIDELGSPTEDPN